jgi:CBS domain-containing protein
MSNVIPQRILSFIKDYPPFSFLAKAELLDIAKRVTVRYCPPKTTLFSAGDPTQGHVYLIREGAINLLDGNQLVDTCDEGDLLGIRPLLAGRSHLLTAQVQEETLVYIIPAAVFTEQMAAHPSVTLYLARLVAEDTQRRFGVRSGAGLLNDPTERGEEHAFTDMLRTVPNREPVTCSPEYSIRKAARIMSAEQVSSIIVVDMDQRPLGIVTDKDLRRRVATGNISIDSPVSQLMSAPVHTVPPNQTLADVQIDMVKIGIHHLVVTEDGSDQSAVVGVVTEHEVLVTQGQHPAVFLRRIHRAAEATELADLRVKAELLLRQYLDQEISISFIASIMTAINDEITRRIIDRAVKKLTQKGYGEPPAPFCWLALGSAGREEQLLRTDQDSALLFEPGETVELETSRNYFLELARLVTSDLVTVGFKYCPADMMASNPKWCLSFEEWKIQFSTWIDDPAPKAILHSSIFFDYRSVYGPAELTTRLTEHIFRDLHQKKILLRYLAREAVQKKPPLSFFRSFVVERSGEHKDAFDLKARAMMPLTDAARVLTLDIRIDKENNTFSRFKRLAELEPQNADIYREAAAAYEILMRYRAAKGLKQGDSGRYIYPDSLSKLERINLRHCFKSVRELQSLLITRFQLAQMI